VNTAPWMPAARPPGALRQLYALSAAAYPGPVMPPWPRREHHNELDPQTPVWLTERPAIGDAYLGEPAVRCEMAACRIVHRGGFSARQCWLAALAAGWRLDWVGRRACPRCQQNRPAFWRPPATGNLPAVWDRRAALHGVARMLPPPAPAAGGWPAQPPATAGRRRHRKDVPP